MYITYFISHNIPTECYSDNIRKAIYLYIVSLTVIV